MRDPYRILSVPRDADRTAILHAFRALAQELHPDRGGDPELMQQINEAWAILSRPAYRHAYDEARAAALERRRQRAQDKAQTASAMPPRDHAAPTPPPKPARERRPDSLDYGRYEGWTIRELAQADPDYLLWLARTPAGRMYQTRINEALDERERSSLSRVAVETSGSRRRR